MSDYSISLTSAVDSLKSIFTDPNKDYLSKEEIFQNANKLNSDKTWFKTKLNYFRAQDLVEVKKGKNKKNRPLIIGIELNERGKIALGRIEGQLQPLTRSNKTIIEKKPQNEVLSSIKPESQIIKELADVWKNTDNSSMVYDTVSGTITLKK